jgi:hypothetical protein
VQILNLTDLVLQAGDCNSGSRGLTESSCKPASKRITGFLDVEIGSQSPGYAADFATHITLDFTEKCRHSSNSN